MQRARLWSRPPWRFFPSSCQRACPRTTQGSLCPPPRSHTPPPHPPHRRCALELSDPCLSLNSCNPVVCGLPSCSDTALKHASDDLDSDSSLYTLDERDRILCLLSHLTALQSRLKCPPAPTFPPISRGNASSTAVQGTRNRRCARSATGGAEHAIGSSARPKAAMSAQRPASLRC